MKYVIIGGIIFYFIVLAYNANARRKRNGVTAVASKKLVQYKCTCRSCNNIFYYSENDIAKDKEGRWADLASTINLVNGNSIESSNALNHQQQAYTRNFNKCPNCGSELIEKVKEEMWLDSNGNIIENYSPTAGQAIAGATKGAFSLFGDVAFGTCSLVTFVLVLGIILIVGWIAISVLKIFF